MNDNTSTSWEPAVPPFSEDTIIEHIMLSYTESAVRRIFDELDLHCFECAVGREDDLADVARLHGKEKEHLIDELSRRFDQEDPLNEPSYYDSQ